jgi:hypothetical protein
MDLTSNLFLNYLFFLLFLKDYILEDTFFEFMSMEIFLDLAMLTLTNILLPLIILVCVVFPLGKLYIFLKKSDEKNDKLAMLMFVILSICLFFEFLSKKISLSELINYIIAVATLSFFIIYNYRIVKMQEDVKNIQEKEFNLKTIEYLNSQRNEIYSPLDSILYELKKISKYIMQINNIPPLNKLEKLEREIEKIIKSSEPINQKDFEKINLIKNVYTDILVNTCHLYMSEHPNSLSEDDMNKLRFDLTSQFIKYYYKVDEKTKTQIDLIRSQDIFQHKINELTFENGLICINKQKKYSNKDLIPILTIFFENQLEYFSKIKKGIDENLDEVIPIDVSKFADEN